MESFSLKHLEGSPFCPGPRLVQCGRGMDQPGLGRDWMSSVEPSAEECLSSISRGGPHMGRQGRTAAAGTGAVSAARWTTLGGEPVHSLFHPSHKYLSVISNGSPGILSCSGPGVMPA